MRWNWQQTDWPRFSWEAARLVKAEERFLLAAGGLVGAVRHLQDEDRDQLFIEVMSEEALTTSEIEGEFLDRMSVQSSIRRELGLAHDAVRSTPAEQGIGELMVDVYRGFAASLTREMLWSWHSMVMRGRSDLRDVGGYRTHEEAMQVVSGRLDAPKVHFEAPPSARVAGEMERYVEWFNSTAPGAAGSLPALTRAGAAHLYFESIHPFEDGNGRIGRAIAEKALAQSLGRATLTGLSATVLSRRSSYYDALERANKRNEISGWLAWFAGLALEAQWRTSGRVEFLIEKTKLLDRVRKALNTRQLAVVVRMLREGPEGFKGGLSAGKYQTIAKTSAASATRDLSELVELGVLVRSGERRHARYELVVPVRKVPRIEVDERGDIVVR